jgi:predicted nuclease of predicted toxin-antitoxin system
MKSQADAPQFLADECVYQETVNFLCNLDFDVLKAQDLSLRGAPDRQVLDKAQELNRVLLTNDRGFGDIRRYPPSRHQGVILLRIKGYRFVHDVHSVLQDLLSHETRFRGALFIVDRHKWRKRRTP